MGKRSHVSFATTHDVRAYLEVMLETGLYGTTIAGVVEELVRRGIRAEIEGGTLERFYGPDLHAAVMSKVDELTGRYGR